MNVRPLNAWIWLATAVVAAAAPVALYAGLFAALDGVGATRADAASPAKQPSTQPGEAAVPSVESFGPSLARTFRPALAHAAADGPSAATAVVDLPAGAVPAQLQMVGSVGESLAILKGPDGNVALVEVGDDVNGARVLRITPSRVDLEQDGRKMTLQKRAASAAAGVELR